MTETAPTNKTYIDTREAAALLQVHEMTCRRWQIKGMLPHYRFGSKVRYCKEELERWMEAQRVPIAPGEGAGE